MFNISKIKDRFENMGKEKNYKNLHNKCEKNQIGVPEIKI